MPTAYKGIDDLLAAGGRPRRLEGRQVHDYFQRQQAVFNGDTAGEETKPSAPAKGCTRPAFPVGVFPEQVAKFVQQVAAAVSCPADFPGVAALVVAGAAIGNARCLQVKEGWTETGGIYATIVAKPGAAKTPALKQVMAPFLEAQNCFYREHQHTIRDYQRQVAEYRRSQRSRRGAGANDSGDEPQAPMPLRHLFASDTTIEALGEILQNSPKGILVYRDELTAWVASMNQYRKGADRQFYLSTWSGELVKVDRKTSLVGPIIIPRPFLSVLGGIQPEMLFALEGEGNRDDGFLDRVLFSYPGEQRFQGWTDQEIEEESRDDWRCTLNRLLVLEPSVPDGGGNTPKIVHFDDSGRKAFAAYLDKLARRVNTGEMSPRMVGVCAKLRSYCARFALILHVLRWQAGDFDDVVGLGEGMVDAEDVRRAILLCDYFEKHAAAVHGTSRQSAVDKQVASLIAWMTRRKLQVCSNRDLMRSGVPGVKTKSEAKALLSAAVDREVGEWAPPVAGKEKDTFVLFSTDVEIESGRNGDDTHDSAN